MNKKQVLFFNTFKEIIQIFGESEIGSSQIDIDALIDYLSSDKFFNDSFDYNSEEEAQQFVTDYILDGFPVWRFLKCSDWTKKMLEKSFTEECAKEYNQMLQEYKCLSCKYFWQTNTSLGLYINCKHPDNQHKYTRTAFSLKKECGFFEKGI